MYLFESFMNVIWDPLGTIFGLSLFHCISGQLTCSILHSCFFMCLVASCVLSSSDLLENSRRLVVRFFVLLYARKALDKCDLNSSFVDVCFFVGGCVRVSQFPNLGVSDLTYPKLSNKV